MKMIVGLGNPGKTYEKTRHNTGFLVLDEIAKQCGVSSLQTKFKAQIATVVLNNENVILVKPQTFMNLSGEAVGEIARFYQISAAEVIVIYDDLDLPVGKVRLREKGSAGGHNGMKSIIQHLHTQEFPRIRVGIDKNPMIPTIDYVMGKIEKDKQVIYEKAIQHAAKAAIDFSGMPFAELMNKYNMKAVE